MPYAQPAPYITQIDEVSSEDSLSRSVNGTDVFSNRWPTHVGVCQLVCGLVTVILGLLEVFILPILRDDPRVNVLQSSCFAVAIWTGVMLVIAGSFALRATITRRTLAVYRFFIANFICLLVYITAMIVIIEGFDSGRTLRPAYLGNSGRFTTHLLVSVAVTIGLLLQIFTFILYYEDILFGQYNLFWRCMMCSVPCFLRADISGDGHGAEEIV